MELDDFLKFMRTKLLGLAALQVGASVIADLITGDDLEDAAEDICKCLAVLEGQLGVISEVLLQTRDAILGRDVEKRSVIRGLPGLDKEIAALDEQRKDQLRRAKLGDISVSGIGGESNRRRAKELQVQIDELKALKEQIKDKFSIVTEADIERAIEVRNELADLVTNRSGFIVRPGEKDPIEAQNEVIADLIAQLEEQRSLKPSDDTGPAATPTHSIVSLGEEVTGGRRLRISDFSTTFCQLR